MKRFTQFVSLMLMAWAVLMPSQMKAQDDADWQLILEEDFSQMTEGSEDAPCEDFIAGNNGGNIMIDDQYFHTSGWSGANVHQAGGMVYLYDGTIGGVLNTPMGDYSGHVKVTFRAKAVGGKFTFLAVWCPGSPLSPSGSPMADYDVFNLNEEDGWVDIETEATFSNTQGYFEINGCMYCKPGLLVDDFKVYRDVNYVPAPTNLSFSNYTKDGFTLTWDKAIGADSYLVNLFDASLMPVVADAKAETNEYTFTGLDLTGNYYASVTSMSGDKTGGISDAYAEYGLPAPVAIPATDLDERGSFTANWEETVRAQQYFVHTFKYVVADESKETEVFNEDFAANAWGSWEAFSYEYGINSANIWAPTSLDEYCDNKGWFGQGTVLGGTYVGCWSPQNDNPRMITPAINLTNNGGKFKVTTTFAGDDYSNLYVECNGVKQQIEFDMEQDYYGTEPVTKTETLEFDNGDAATRLVFSSDLTFLLDKVVITQESEEGKEFVLGAGMEVVDAPEVEGRISALDSDETTKYGYNVEACYTGADYAPHFSAASNTIIVNLNGEATAISAPQNDNNAQTIYTIEGQHVMSPIRGINIINGKKVVVK